MENNFIEHHTRWTWADLMSSYSFWGLVIFSFFITVNAQGLFFIMPSLMFKNGYSHVEMSLLLSAVPFARLLGIIPAWIASRTKSHFGLYVFSGVIIMALIGGYLFFSNLTILMICVCIIHLFATATGLLVAGIIAKALDSVEFYVLIFGLLFALTILGTINYSFSAHFIINKYDYKFISIMSMIQVIVGMLLLLPIKISLFTQSPPLRQVARSGKMHHDPILTFLLAAFIPFYCIFWFVRVYREIRNYSQSAKLLTPTGAGWCSLLVPFAIPVMLITLNDVLDEQQSLPKSNRWGLILLSLFLFPVAVAIVQNRLNQLPNN